MRYELKFGTEEAREGGDGQRGWGWHRGDGQRGVVG